MSETTFLAAQRAPVLINRTQELETLRQAVYQPEADFQIVFIRGKGGMGKSRLVEEALWRGGNPILRQAEQRGPIPDSHHEWDWTQHGKAIFANLIDMSAPTLHSRTTFLRAVRDALVWRGQADFTRYDAAFDAFRRQQAYMGDYDYLQQLEQQAEQKFLEDYCKNAQSARIVLTLDTVEKLQPIGGTELLLEEGLLRPKDIEFYTYQWLLQKIRDGGLPNTTLLVVGRAEEGGKFFKAVEEAAAGNPACKVTPLPEISSFSLEDTQTCFSTLLDSWREQASSAPQFESLALALESLANDSERIETLWIYTGGQPVRLALYTDLMLEDWQPPERLQESPAEARKLLANEDELEKARQEIEAGLIRLLFGRPNLRAEILKALVRAPRGLSAEQLHYALIARPEETPEDWQQRVEGNAELQKLRQDIAAELEALKRLAIVKIRPDGRLGLQDEVYRIYTNALKNKAEDREAEIQARKPLYRKLEAWTRHQFEGCLKELTDLQARDERQLRFERPSLALEVKFSPLPRREQEQRDRLRAELQQWEFEALHYALLSDFRHNFNHASFEIADQKWIANNEDTIAILQAERWQLLWDPAYAVAEFGGLQAWESLQRRGESPFEALRRVALQDDVVFWIKLFGLRREYDRAIEFAGQVEQTIQKWAVERKNDNRFLPASWLHTLARHERALWRNYARLITGQEALAAIREMEEAVSELETLLQRSQEEMVFAERRETGFHGHPAESKLQRLVALYYNYIGYGYATLGATLKAEKAYGRALRRMREVEFPHMEATTRNNLSRVLSDRGHTRGRRLCLDALELRKEQGAENPIAYSYNTLALIDNDHMRPDLAWREAALAVAYFRQLNDQRGLGLALLQLGEALRRLAIRESETYYLQGDMPEMVLETAERATNEALHIFSEGPASKEIVRRVEAMIEKGSLERDYLLVTSHQESRARHYREALYYFEQAATLASQRNNKRLELDARVDIAWTHFYFGKHAEAEQALQEAESLLPTDCRLTENLPLPVPERDDLYVYQFSSKIYGLRGRMALKQFRRREEEFKEKESDKETRRRLLHEDSQAQAYLRQAAEAYVLALAYAQLLSPRSSALVVIYDDLYRHLKEFNLTELEDFQTYVRESRQRYKVKALQTADLADADAFLQQTFGLEGDEQHG